MGVPMAATAWCNQAVLDRIIRARTDAGLSQLQAARLLGISNVTLSRYEAGARTMPRHRLDRMAQVYGVSVEWLLEGKPSLSDAQAEAIRERLKGIPQDAVDKAIALLSSMAGIQKEDAS